MRTIGIIGGMGPAATIKMQQQIFDATVAKNDQDHVPVITYSFPQMPDRTQAILYGGQSPVPDLQRVAKVLEDGGASALLMPCNTAHYFIEDVRAAVSIPVIDMIEETAKFIFDTYGDVKVGLLATNGTVLSGIYQDRLSKYGIDLVIPDEIEQETLVMDSIYGEQGVKAGFSDEPAKLLQLAVDQLLKKGAQIIIGGCTEIPLVLKEEDIGMAVVDPSKIVAEMCVKYCMEKVLV